MSTNFPLDFLPTCQQKPASNLYDMLVLYYKQFYKSIKQKKKKKTINFINRMAKINLLSFLVNNSKTTFLRERYTKLSPLHPYGFIYNKRKSKLNATFIYHPFIVTCFFIIVFFFLIFRHLDYLTFTRRGDTNP